MAPRLAKRSGFRQGPTVEEIEQFAQKLKFFVLKNFKLQKKTRKTISFEISNSLSEWLNTTQGMNFHKFQESEFLENLEIPHLRFLKPDNSLNLFGARFKLRRSFINYFKDASCMKKERISGPIFFCFKLYVIENR